MTKFEDSKEIFYRVNKDIFVFFPSKNFISLENAKEYVKYLLNSDYE
jgi:hypothetical protein